MKKEQTPERMLSVIKNLLPSTSRPAFTLGVIAVLSACDNNAGNPPITVSADSFGVVSLGVPELLKPKALDIDSLRLNVLVNDNEVPASRNGDVWNVTFTVAPNSPYDLSIIWNTDDGLLLARLDAEQPAVQANVSQMIDSSQYVSRGDSQFDVDDDGVSNLDEVNGESDPFDAASPRRLVSVGIPRIDPSDAPDIDGFYDNVWRTSGQFTDTDGNTLAINRLLGGSDLNRSDGNTEFQWAAMHDGVRLYLFIFGEDDSTPGGQAVADSQTLFHDDSIELFFDGNYSQGFTYDGVDDTSIIISLLDLGGNITGRIAQGAPGSQPIPAGIEFVNCLCSPVYSWEVAIPLASVNIDPDRTFGMEVQLNDDNDGGTRDAYWGWIQSSSTSATFFVPAIMGAIRLE